MNFANLANRATKRDFFKPIGVSGWLIGAWVLTMISVPIFKWVYGEPAVPAVVAVAVVLQAAAVLLILMSAWGIRRTLLTALTVVALGWAVEFIGSKTDFPFGAYDYTGRLQPQLAGVPLIIPLAWLMMMPPAWAIAQSILGRGESERLTFRRRILFIVVTALAFTAWDLFLDPQMVNWGFWAWEQPSGYFGIPWVNFGGWLLASSLITAVVNPAYLPVAALRFVYVITWFLMSIGLFVFWNLPGPAIVGSLAMGGMLWLSLRRERQQTEREANPVNRVE